jgi:predicted small lipoprotein YifL
MTPIRALAAILTAMLVLGACGDSGPGEDGELPAAFTVMEVH